MHVLNLLGGFDLKALVHNSPEYVHLVSEALKLAFSDRERFYGDPDFVDVPIRGYDDVEKGDYITLRASDTGIGMSPMDMERIFEPFYTKKVMGRSGTGLGMAVVWGTVKDHKGYIDMKSSIGKGTTFTLYFPVTRDELTKEKLAISIEDYKSSNEELILVVDDVEEQRDLAYIMLKK